MNRRRPAALRVEARAKLNLGLAVGPLRPDGYHDLATVFQSITLADTLLARATAGRLALRLRHEDAAIAGAAGATGRRLVPAGRDNLVLRAARLARERLGIAGGAEFTLVKRIPAQAGMGGGSADAAAALLAMGRLHGVRLPLARWLELGAELGSDVPFAILGGTALGRGRGERLRGLVLERPFRVLVAVPSWRISTAEAYGRIDNLKYALTTWRGKLRFAQSLGRSRVTPMRAMRLGNTFEQVLGARWSDLDDLRRRLLAAGARDVRMTGSGSAVFAILPHGRPASEVVGRFKGSERLFLARSAKEGLRFRSVEVT